MLYSELGPRDQALFDEAGGGDGTFVSSRMVQALNGNGNAAIFLSQLMKWCKWKADDDGWFFRTREQMEKQSGLSDGAQRTAEKTLKSLGLIETDRRGMPAKKHYRLNIQCILSVLAGDQQDMGGSGGNKSPGVTQATSHGGYPQEQVDGGSGGNPNYKSNTESNTQSNTENDTSPSSNDSGDGASHPPTREGPTTVEWEPPSELFDDAVPMPAPTGDGAPPQKTDTDLPFDVPPSPEVVREFVGQADVGGMPWKLAQVFRALFCPWMDNQELRQSKYIGRLTNEANRMVGEVNHDGEPMDKPRSRIELAVALLHLYQERDDLHGREDPGARKDQPTAALNVIADQITRKVKDDEQQPENDFRPDDPLHQLVREVEQSHA